MIYLAHTSGAIAARESAATVQARERDGFVRVKRAEYIAYRRRKERAAFARMAWQVGGTRVRQVGGWAETIIRRAT